MPFLPETLKERMSNIFGSIVCDAMTDEVRILPCVSEHSRHLCLVPLLRWSRVCSGAEVQPPSTTVSWGTASFSSWYTPLTHWPKVSIRLWFGALFGAEGKAVNRPLFIKHVCASVTNPLMSSCVSSARGSPSPSRRFSTTAQFTIRDSCTRNRSGGPFADSVFWCLQHKNSLLPGRADIRAFSLPSSWNDSSLSSSSSVSKWSCISG